VKPDFIRLPKKKKQKKKALSETAPAAAVYKTKKSSIKPYAVPSLSKSTSKKKNKADDELVSEGDAESFHNDDEENGEMP